MSAIAPSLQQGGCLEQHSTGMASIVSFGMLREAMVCDVCREVYDEARKTPLFLRCGHTFCRHCLLKREASSQTSCPSCSKEHWVPVKNLKVNFSLLNITPLYSDFQYEECTTHRDALRYWCCTCGLALCILCLHSRHPQDHSVKLTQAFLQDEKLRLQEKLKSVPGIVEDQKSKLKDDFNNLDTGTKELFLKRASMQKIEQDLHDLFVKIQKAEDIASIQRLEKAVADFCPVVKTMLPSANKPTTGTINDSGEDAADHERQTTQVQRAVMDFRDDRLHLLYPQMPSEVFLELSVGDRRLGCVYITLLCHMRLAQQFLAFCMGMGRDGFKCVKSHLKEREVIYFKHNVSPSEIEDLLYFPQHLVQGKSLGNSENEGYILGTCNRNDFQFGICTKTHSGVIQGNAVALQFGMVVAGLNVAREAFLHDPVTDVTVTDCGLVLPLPSFVPT